MPKKIRELKSLLLKAGFSWRPGKGSHTKWIHPLLLGNITLSGKDGDDATEVLELLIESSVEEGKSLPEPKTLGQSLQAA